MNNQTMKRSIRAGDMVYMSSLKMSCKEWNICEIIIFLV